MRDDAPAALSLIAFASALAIGPWLVNPKLAIAGTLAMCALWSARRSRRAARAPAVFLALFAAGVMVANCEQSKRAREAAVFAAIDPETFSNITAPIDRDWSFRGASFVLRTHAFEADGLKIDRPLLIYVRATPPRIANETMVHARGFLRRNERGAYTVTVKSPALLSYEGELSPWSPARWNRVLTRRVESYAARYPVEVALIEAIALGRAERLDDDVRDDFKRGGTYHLLVFSGLQIALAAACMALLLRWLGMPRVSDVSLLAFAVIAPLFAGASASVMRASIAIGLYAVSRLLHRPTSLENLWALSALVRLAVVPAELTDAGFHLTYAGAGALLFLARRLPKRIRWLAGAAAAEAAVTPLTLFHFHQYAIGGSLMTIVMTPLIFVMLIISVATIALPSAPLFLLIRVLHISCTAINAAGSLTSGFFAAPPPAAMILGFGTAVAAIASVRKGRRTIIALALLVPTATAVARHLSLRSVAVPELTFLDVGQGDAIVARDGGHTLLVDGGGRADDHRFGEATLLPMLVDRGVQHIEAIVLTHIHPDHCGGLPSAIRRLRVDELWISPRQFRGICAQELLGATLDRHVPVHIVRDGDGRWIGSFRMDARVPSRTYRRAPENNSSVVIRLRAARLSALLTGDIERETEAELVSSIARAAVLKVAHHGSRSSTTAAFLDAVAPRVAVISCGRHNLFGHPHPSVIERLRERRIYTLRTDTSGSIEITFQGAHLAFKREIDTFITGATVSRSYVLDAPPAGYVGTRHRAGVVRDPAEFRGVSHRRVLPVRHAAEGGVRQPGTDPGGCHLPSLRDGSEEGREKPLCGLPHTHPAWCDLLPRAPPQRAAQRGREDARHESAAVAAGVTQPLIVVAGPTGTGKSGLAIALAEAIGGEIVNYDSVQVYRGFDIGSAKPSVEERRRVPHHLFDIVEATDELNAAEFARRARAVCAEIASRGRRVILAGGTFFYLRALLAGLPEMPPRDEAIRARLRSIAAKPRGQQRLHRWLSKIDPQSGRKIAPADRHRVERALEVWVSSHQPISTWEPPTSSTEDEISSIKLALRLDRDRLRELLDARVDAMYARGLVDETRALLKRYPRTARPFSAIGYAEAAAVAAGDITASEAIAETKRRTRSYAKRQMTWLRAERNVHWIDVEERDDALAEALRIVEGGS